MSNEQQHMLGRSQRMQEIERVRNTSSTVQYPFKFHMSQTDDDRRYMGHHWMRCNMLRVRL